jgi:hypothetical protein
MPAVPCIDSGAARIAETNALNLSWPQLPVGRGTRVLGHVSAFASMHRLSKDALDGSRDNWPPTFALHAKRNMTEAQAIFDGSGA